MLRSHHPQASGDLKRPIFRKVKTAGGNVLLNMEVHSLKGLTIDLRLCFLDESKFQGSGAGGIALPLLSTGPI